MSVQIWYEARFCGWPLDPDAHQICGVAEEVHYDYMEDEHPFESIKLAIHKIRKHAADKTKEEQWKSSPPRPASPPTKSTNGTQDS